MASDATPLTPRTYEIVNEGCRIEAEIDAAFKSIATRWRERGATRSELDLSRSQLPPPEVCYDEDYDDLDLELSRCKDARSRVAKRIESAKNQASPKKSPSVPLLKTSDGKVLVNVKALQRKSVSQLLRPVDSQQAITPRKVERAWRARAAMKKSQSAPNIVQRNHEDTRSWRPDVRQHHCTERNRARREHAEVVRIRHQMEVDVLRARACNAARERAEVREATREDRQDSSRLLKSSLSELVTAFFFRLLAVEAFIGGIHRSIQAQHHAVAQQHWELLIKFVRVVRAIGRWRRRILAGWLVQRVVMQVPWTYRTRMVFRKQTIAGLRLQRGWRAFNEKVAALVQELLDGPWQKQELWLLEMIFRSCPDAHEIIVEDPSLLHHSMVKEGEMARSQHRQNDLARLSSQEDTFKKSVKSILAANRIKSAFSKPSSRPPATPGNTSSSRPPANPGNASSSNRHGLGTTASKSRLGQSRAKLEDAQLQAMLQQEFEQVLQHKVLSYRFRTDVAERILHREIIERLWEHRNVKGSMQCDSPQTGSHRKICANLRRAAKEAKEARASRVGAVRGKRRKSIARPNFFALFAAKQNLRLPEHIQPSDEEVAEIVLCAHCAQGVRPARETVRQTFYRICPEWRVKAIVELLAGRRTISDALVDRWSAFRTQHRQSMLEQLQQISACVSPPTSPSSSGTSPGRRAQKAGPSSLAGRQALLRRPSSAPAGGRRPAAQGSKAANLLRSAINVRPLALDKSSSYSRISAPREAATARDGVPSTFEDCFMSAEAFCRGVLAHEGAQQTEDANAEGKPEELDIAVCYSTTKQEIGSLQSKPAGARGQDEDTDLLRMLPGLDPVDRPERTSLPEELLDAEAARRAATEQLVKSLPSTILGEQQQPPPQQRRSEANKRRWR